MRTTVVRCAKHRLGDLDVAAPAYRKALAIDDKNADAHNDFGVLLGQQGRTIEAVVHFKAAIALKPDFLEAAQNLESAQRILLTESR
jgi:Tfp pilus assembly protein PilF